MTYKVKFTHSDKSRARIDGIEGGRMIIFCDVENCIYNDYKKCVAGTAEIADGECVTFVGKESEVGEDGSIK